MRICGYETSTFKFGNDTLYLTKHDDGRFEYSGVVTIPATIGNVIIPNPINGIKNGSAIATNLYANSSTIFVSAGWGNAGTRVDVANYSGAVPTYFCKVNLTVKGFWK